MNRANEVKLLGEVEAKAKILHGLVGGVCCPDCFAEMVFEAGKKVCRRCEIEAATRRLMANRKAQNLGSECPHCEGNAWQDVFGHLQPCKECLATGSKWFVLDKDPPAIARVIWSSTKRWAEKRIMRQQIEEREQVYALMRGYEPHEDDYLDMKDELELDEEELDTLGEAAE